jgi:hypothetical protein
MALVKLVIKVKNNRYHIQHKGSLSIINAVEDVCQHVYQKFVGHRVIIHDSEYRQINNGTLLKWLKSEHELTIHVLQARSRPRDYQRKFSINHTLRGQQHVYFYITYTRGTKRMFHNKWAPKCFHLRIEAIEGETIQISLRRDGRVDSWYVHGGYILVTNVRGGDCNFLPSHLITSDICGETFAVKRV